MSYKDILVIKLIKKCKNQSAIDLLYWKIDFQYARKQKIKDAFYRQELKIAKLADRDKAKMGWDTNELNKKLATKIVCNE